MTIKIKNYNKEDQQNVKKAIKLIHELIELNRDIELNIFISAMGNIIVSTFIVNGNSKKDFLKSMNEVAGVWDDEWRKK